MIQNRQLRQQQQQQQQQQQHQQHAVSLNKSSEEYKKVHYLLQLSLSDVEPTETRIWYFNNQYLGNAFEEKMQNMRKVWAWVSTSELDSSNSLESLHSRGFTFPTSSTSSSGASTTRQVQKRNSRDYKKATTGMVFRTGNIKLDRDVPDTAAQRFVLCQVAIGRPYVIDDIGTTSDSTTSSSSRTVPHELPSGYDSFYLARSSSASSSLTPSRQSQSQSQARARPTEFTSPSEYRHEYLITDPSQVLPLYLVQFFPQELGTSTAVQYKEASNRAIVDSSSSSPYKGEAAARGLIDQHEHHPQHDDALQLIYDRYDFFDPILYVPVSVRDKMVGSHSVGEAAQHKLISIGDAYDAAVSESMKTDPLIAARQAELKSNLSEIDGKMRDVERNAAEVEEQIYQVLQESLFKLQELTKEKENVLHAEKVELERQLQYVDWAESFLDVQREEATPVEFLNNWKCHVQLRGDVAQTPIEAPFILSKVHADLSLRGGLDVVQQGSGFENEFDQFDAETSGINAAPMRETNLNNVGTRSDAHHESSRYADGGWQQQQQQEQHPEAINYREQYPSAQSQPQLQPQPQPQPQPQSQPHPQPQPQSQPIPPHGQSQPVIQETSPSQQMMVHPQYQDSFQHYYTQSQPGQPPEYPEYTASPSSSWNDPPAPLTDYPHLVNAHVADRPTSPPPPPSSKLPGFKDVSEQREKGYISERVQDVYAPFALSAEATRRLRQRKNVKELPEFETFAESQVVLHPVYLNPKAKERFDEVEELRQRKEEPKDGFPIPSSIVANMTERHVLSFALPFFEPDTELLFATWRDERTLKSFLDSMPRQVLTNKKTGEQKEVLENIKTVVLIKANGKVFGGFANEPWRSDGQTFGSAQCFLFSLTEDVKIPFKGQDVLPPSEEAREIARKKKLPDPKFAALRSSPEAIEFGVGDLVLKEDFQNCSCALEHSFGIYMDPDSSQAGNLLAGSSSFVPEEVELWEVRESGH